MVWTELGIYDLTSDWQTTQPTEGTLFRVRHLSSGDGRGLIGQSAWAISGSSSMLQLFHVQPFSQKSPHADLFELIVPAGLSDRCIAFKSGKSSSLWRIAIDVLSSTIVMNCPTGSIVAFVGSAVPAGWLFCNGAAVSRSTYSSLFALIATTYGAGDGSTTFNLPDLRGRSPVGAGQATGLTNRVLGASGGSETHTLSVAELPAHSHNAQHGSGLTVATSTQFSSAGTRGTTTPGPTTTPAGEGQAHNNMPPFLSLNFLIKV